MSPPAFHRDGDRLVFPLRPDKRAMASSWRTIGAGLAALGAVGVGLVGQWQTGLGAVCALAAIVGLITVGMAALGLWVNRQTVVFDPGAGTFQGLELDPGDVAALRLRERVVHHEGSGERRVVLDLVLGAELDEAQRAALATQTAPEALSTAPGVLLTDHADEDRIQQAARALARAMACPLLDAASTPPRWSAEPTPADALKHATTALPALPGATPPAHLTVHSLRPLHVTWRGVRYQGALWATLGFLTLPFGAGLAIHRGQWDGPTLALVGVPLAVFGYGLLTRRGTHALRIDGQTVRSVHAGLYDLEVAADQVLGFRDQTTSKGGRMTGFRLPDASSWGVFPDDDAAAEWLKAAAERAIRTGGAD